MTPLAGFWTVWRALVFGPGRRHPARVLLPVLGVAIGVAAVAAIHRANASVTESFRSSAASLSGRSDLVVTGVSGVPVADLERLAFLWDSGSFAPAVTGWVVVADRTGDLAELVGLDVGDDPAARDWKLLGDPRASRARLLSGDAVFVGAPFAARHALSVGDRLALAAGGRRHELTVAGVLSFSGLATAAAGDLLITDLFTAQRLLGRTGRVDRVDVFLDEGVDREEVRRRLAASLPPGLRVEPPGRAAEAADRMVRAFRFNLNALASLTLLVAMFLVTNAVSISVLRRRPEIAAVRSVGGSRAVVAVVFLLEGLAVGAAGTALGEAGGVFLSRAALAAVSATVTGIYVPTARIAASGYRGAALLAGAVGLLTAVAAAVVPAIEASRVEPAAAARSGTIETARRRRTGPRAALALACLAAAAAAAAAPPVDGFPAFGFAAVVLVVGALALAAPAGVRLAERLALGPLARVFGEPGRLAGRAFGGSLARNGLSVAALAMALGMTLAMLVTVASIRETVRVWVESTLRSDLWIKAAAGRSSGLIGDLPPDVLEMLREIPGVAALDPFRARDQVDARGRTWTLAAGDFRVLARVGGLPVTDRIDPREAAQRARAGGEVFVSEPYSRRFGVRRGDFVAIPTPRGERRFRIAAVYRDYSNDRGTVVLDRDAYVALFDDRRVTSVAVLAAPGEDPAELRRRILAAAEGRFALSISTNRELRREALRIFDRTFAVTRALEAIAVAVAVLGVANALTASAVERRRSFGLLRAVGASGRQIRLAVLLEAALSGATGVAAALPAAAAFSFLLLAVINPQSFGWTVVPRVPAARLAAVAASVFAASVLAGLHPSRLAAAVDPADALAEE